MREVIEEYARDSDGFEFIEDAGSLDLEWVIERVIGERNEGQEAMGLILELSE